MLSTPFKFSEKDTPCNCADTKQNCVFLAFPSDLSCVSLLLRNKNYNYMLLILIFIYIYIYIIYTYIYIYIYTYIYICIIVAKVVTKGRREIYL